MFRFGSGAKSRIFVPIMAAHPPEEETRGGSCYRCLGLFFSAHFAITILASRALELFKCGNRKGVRRAYEAILLRLRNESGGGRLPTAISSSHCFAKWLKTHHPMS